MNREKKVVIEVTPDELRRIFGSRACDRIFFEEGLTGTFPEKEELGDVELAWRGFEKLVLDPKSKYRTGIEEGQVEGSVGLTEIPSDSVKYFCRSCGQRVGSGGCK